MFLELHTVFSDTNSFCGNVWNKVCYFAVLTFVRYLERIRPVFSDKWKAGRCCYYIYCFCFMLEYIHTYLHTYVRALQVVFGILLLFLNFLPLICYFRMAYIFIVYLFSWFILINFIALSKLPSLNMLLQNGLYFHCIFVLLIYFNKFYCSF